MSQPTLNGKEREIPYTKLEKNQQKENAFF